ncbi:hypothetical protein EB118_18725 [bacterium]|nr:hypothetical protein [bacterium]NDD85350.1 hypothetical protein [bacterium]NDG32095.1 hypothetical protein [bacterium]
MDNNNKINSVIYCIECSLARMKWYQETGETRFFDDSAAYLDVANIYIREIINENSKSTN